MARPARRAAPVRRFVGIMVFLMGFDDCECDEGDTKASKVEVWGKRGIDSKSLTGCSLGFSVRFYCWIWRVGTRSYML